MTGRGLRLDKKPMSLGVTAEGTLLTAVAGAAESPLEAETGLRETVACTAAAAWEAGEAVVTVSSVKVSTLYYSTSREAAVHSLSLTQCVIITSVALRDSLQHDARTALMHPQIAGNAAVHYCASCALQLCLSIHQPLCVSAE
jgi:hypothetical protein